MPTDDERSRADEAAVERSKARLRANLNASLKKRMAATAAETEVSDSATSEPEPPKETA